MAALSASVIAIEPCLDEAYALSGIYQHLEVDPRSGTM